MKTIPKKTFPKLFKATVGGKVQEWEIWVEPGKGGTGIINTVFGLADGKKQHLKDEVKQGKNVGKKNETTPYQQAVLEAEAEWRKQLERKGYGLTADASAEVRSASPMLAQPFEKVKDIDWTTAFGQPKLDGFRMLALRTEDGLILKSRENKPIATMQHIHEQLMGAMEPGQTLDGELYCHDLTFQQIASAVKKRSELSERIVYNVYDMLSEDTFKRRFEALKGIVRGLPNVVDVQTIMVRTKDDLMVAQREFIDQGYEGAMLRHGRVGYEAGKRSKFLVKVKTFRDEEFTVVDAKEGRGTHAGMAIFLCETKEGATFEVTAPGTHDEKRAYWKNFKQYIGKLLTVKFFDYTTSEDGKVPRFPVALRFRGD